MYPHLLETQEGFGRDDDVIEHFDPHDLSRLNHAPGQFQVILTWINFPRRVIVGQDDGRRRRSDRRAKNLTRMNQRLAETPHCDTSSLRIT